MCGVGSAYNRRLERRFDLRQEISDPTAILHALMLGFRVGGSPHLTGAGTVTGTGARSDGTLAGMTQGPEIRFLPFAGHRIAYTVTRDGPPLVMPAWWVSHVELDWEDQAFRQFWESVGQGYTLVRYDRLGVGMSDRDVHGAELTLEDDVALLGAVLDDLALEKVVLVGGSSGGCAAIAFAARFPERVDRLLLYGAYADGSSITSPEVRGGTSFYGAVALGSGLARPGRPVLGRDHQRRAGTPGALPACRGEPRDRGKIARPHLSK